MGASLTGLLACLLACPRGGPESPEPRRRADSSGADDGRKAGGEADSRIDPARCSGADLELERIVGAGLCSITVGEARALPGPELLEITAPSKLVVVSGERLEFDLVVHNRSGDPVDVDLRFRHMLPLRPESTVGLDGAPEPDSSCTLRAISTEPPPERISLAPDAELAVPCEWHANLRLVDPRSYVGSECPDFPALSPGRYLSVYRISGGAGTQREVAVEIEVRAR